ncbi:MAG: FG-GAP repeat domain-containing protein [Nitrospiria bacterium]
MRKFLLKRYSFVILLFLFWGWLFPGCGSKESKDPVVVTITPGDGGQTAQSGFFMLPPRGKVTFKATVSGTLNPAVTWSHAAGGGTFKEDPRDKNNVIYTAAPDAFFGNIARLEARSVENPEAFETATVMLTTLEEPPGQTLQPSVDEIVVGGLPVTQSLTLDFNLDGIIDMASRNRTAGKVTFNISTQSPQGGLSFLGKTIDIPTPVSLVVGDFVNDLDPTDWVADIAVLSKDSVGDGSRVFFLSGAKSRPRDFSPVIIGDPIIIPTGNPRLMVNGRFHNPPGPSSQAPVSDLAIGTNEGEIIVYLQDRNPQPIHKPVAFSSGQTITIGGGVPKQLLAGDFNGDGLKEIAIVREGEDSLFILRGDQMGDFSGPQSPPIQFPAVIESLISADLNGDGIGDLIGAHTTPINQLSVFLGDSTGNFTNATTVPLDFTPGKMAVGEYNLGGNIDLAVTDSSDQKIRLFFGDGSGQFVGEWASKPVLSSPSSLISGSFSGFPATIGFQNADLIYLESATPATPQKLHVFNNRNS